MRIGAIVEQDGAILLERAGPQAFDLPWAATLGTAGEEHSLRGRLHVEGAKADLGFVFAIFEDEENGHVVGSIVYRGTLRKAPAADVRLALFPFDQIPWESVPDEAVRAMLRRYIEERRTNIAGVYVGDAESGVVERILTTA